MTGEALFGLIYVIFVASVLTVRETGEEAMPFTVTVKVTDPVPGNFSGIHLI